MKAKFADDQLKAGTVFIGNVNGAICEITKIETTPSTKNHVSVATIKDRKTGNTFQYGLEALKRCNIQILKE